MSFQNKVVIVTGGGSGIGKATSLLFAENGAKVVVADMDCSAGQETVEEIRSMKGEASFLEVDVADPAKVESMVARAVDTYGGIDVLFNAAAIFRFGTALDTDEKTWRLMHSILLDGTFYCCRAVLPHLIRRGGGSIVNVCSTAGAHDGVANAVAYVAAKGGVALLSKCLAIDYGKDNVRVNVIIPGPTDTPMLRKFWSSDEIQKSAASLPLARVGDARELAQAVLFLASDQASFITGVLLPVDGGQMAGGLSRKLN